MTNTTDARVEKLQAGVNKKREEIKKKDVGVKFATNKILSWQNDSHNLNVTASSKLVIILGQLQSVYTSVQQLETELGQYTDLASIGGYSLLDWIDDIRKELFTRYLKEEKKKLSQMESVLEDMLSEDKKKEKILDQFEEMLK